MRSWLRGKRGGLVAFALICTLFIGGLGWVTAAVLRLEEEQREAQEHARVYEEVKLALWRLDSLIAPLLAKENSRPYNHYSAIYALPGALRANGTPWPAGAVLEISPLVESKLPDWMLLHFQTDETGWRSPQVRHCRNL